MDIDLEQWDRAIAASAKNLPYAYCWYLDIVSKGRWDGLVEGPYERVMPLVWNAKLLFWKQVYQPVLTQQLGIFGALVEEKDYLAFLKAIPDAFRYTRMNLNRELGTLDQLNGHIHSRTNLILDLNRPYESIRASYSKSLRKRLKKAGRIFILEETSEVQSLVNSYREQLENKVQLGQQNYQVITLLIREALRRGHGKVYKVCDEAGAVYCIGFFLATPKRIINVFGASNEKGKDRFAMHFMLDRIIRTYAGTNMIFDFEGSEIPGVAEFFRSFGSVEENYSVYELNRLPYWLSSLLGRPMHK